MNATMIDYRQTCRNLDRMVVECGDELTATSSSPRLIAIALLESADPPTGTDRELCEGLAAGTVWLTTPDERIED